MKMKLNKKGFTLAELLIVVAIIAVLVAISIPIFTAQLEKAREATDAANIRDYYAEIAVALLDGSFGTGNTTLQLDGSVSAAWASTTDGYTVTVSGFTVQQKTAKWQTGDQVVAGVTIDDENNDMYGKTKIVYTFKSGTNSTTSNLSTTYLSGISFS